MASVGTTAKSVGSRLLLRSATRSRVRAGAIVAIAAAVLASPAVAAERGRFEVVGADSRTENGWILVDARVDLELSDETVAALESGVTLTLQYQFELIERLRFWPNKIVADPKRNIELRYMSLSERFLVVDTDSGVQESFATLYSALRYAGQLRDYPLIEAERLEPDARYGVATRMVLNRETLPGPLQMLAFWRGDFSLESDWFRWTLRE